MKVPLADGVVDVDRRRVHRRDQTTHLTTREADLLRYLAERPGVDVDKDALLTDVWGYRASNPTRAVEHTALRLRAKIEVDPSHPVHLLTVRGVGYRWVTPEHAVSSAPAPASQRPLVGRDAELDALRTLLEHPGPVVVLGPGGIGKTSLARAVAPALEVDLSGAADESDLIRATAAQLAVPLVGPDPVGTVGAALAALGSVIVLFDSVDHATAAARDVFGRWRALAPELTLLATSRERPRLAGERLLELGPLSREDATTLLLERAAELPQADASWGDRAALGPLADRLDRIPLALELAAGRASVLTVDQVEALLAERFRLLVDPDSDRLPRHQTLRACVAWSWGLLSDGERAALEHLAVFRGGLDLVAAEAVLPDDGPWALDVVQDLVDRSLLQLGPVVRGRRRYRVLDTVRDFVLEQSADRGATARRAHARYWLEAAAERADGLEALPAEQHWFERELPDLLAALEVLDDRDAARLGLWVGASLVRSGPPAQRRAVLDATIHRAEASGDPVLLALALGTRARDRRDTPAAARADLDRALGLLDAPSEARGLVQLWSGIQRSWRHDLEGALADVDDAIATLRRSGAPRRQALALATRSALLSQAGRATEALHTVDRALAILVDHPDDDRGRALALATRARMVPRLDEAIGLLGEAEALLDALGDSPAELPCALTRIDLELSRGRLELDDELARLLGRARALGYRVSEGWVHRALAALAIERGETGSARTHLAEAREGLGDGAPVGAADLERLALRLELEHGGSPTGRGRLERWVEAVSETHPQAAAEAARLEAALHVDRGDPGAALEAVREGLDALAAVPEGRLAADHDLRAVARTRLLGMGAALEAWVGDPAEARRWLAEADSAARPVDLEWRRLRAAWAAHVDGHAPEPGASWEARLAGRWWTLRVTD